MTDERYDAFEREMREATGEALAAFMRYANNVYRDALSENDKLKKRVVYLEERIRELQTTKETV